MKQPSHWTIRRYAAQNLQWLLACLVIYFVLLFLVFKNSTQTIWECLLVAGGGVLSSLNFTIQMLYGSGILLAVFVLGLAIGFGLREYRYARAVGYGTVVIFSLLGMAALFSGSESERKHFEEVDVKTMQ